MKPKKRIIDKKWFTKALSAAKIDLVKLGWSKVGDKTLSDKKILSYIRGYVWKNYGLRIKHPMDLVIIFMLTQILSERMIEKEVEANAVQAEKMFRELLSSTKMHNRWFRWNEK